MGNGNCEIIVLKMQGNQLGDVMFVFYHQDFALPDLADVDSEFSWCPQQRNMRLGWFNFSV